MTSKSAVKVNFFDEVDKYGDRPKPNKTGRKLVSKKDVRSLNSANGRDAIAEQTGSIEVKGQFGNYKLAKREPKAKTKANLSKADTVDRTQLADPPELTE